MIIGLVGPIHSCLNKTRYTFIISFYTVYTIPYTVIWDNESSGKHHHTHTNNRYSNFLGFFIFVFHTFKSKIYFTPIIKEKNYIEQNLQIPTRTLKSMKTQRKKKSFYNKSLCKVDLKAPPIAIITIYNH